MAITGAAAAAAVDIRRVERVSGELAGEVAGVTSAAYEVGDLVPGLPVADGAHETARDVLADVAAGRSLWIAVVDGRCAASVRAVPRADGDWEVRRLAVAPWVRRGGLGTLLLRRLERDASGAGVGRVVLDAVVERGNPAFYARAGFRTVHHFAADDKPLSEVHMERDPSTPALARPHPENGPRPGWAVTWWGVGSTTVACPGPDVPPPAGARALGEDRLVRAGASGEAASAEVTDGEVTDGQITSEEITALLTAGADRSEPDGSLVFGRPAARIRAFAQPRLTHTHLLAWWRSPAVRSHGG
ncbi:GNAT family N-acetyltransferase [Streptomyces sp. NPDC005438]|uniref:GNAT family N-acetyltransferase n=1 Tax=Streptomyces sp. NPDC005438 TaxID=3156880 RepID=UPI0033B1CDF9